VTRILMIVVAMVALAGMARAEDSVLRSLPANLQKYRGRARQVLWEARHPR
jgi:hypothetical protein